MGANLQTEMGNVSDAGTEVKIFRQLRAEYFRLVGMGKTDSEVLELMKKMYQNLIGDGKVVEPFGCPKVRFGRTEIQIPIITCGGMRQQSTWMPKEGTTLKDIDKQCQKNFQEIVDRAMELGINHFETASMYGTSEIQFGECLKKFDRKSFILQTKIAPKENAEDFRKALNKSLENLQVEYIDLLALHGVHRKERPYIEHCLKIANEFRKEGKVKFVGFSSHEESGFICDLIETGWFDFVNLHYHFIGSYTSSGSFQREEVKLEGNNSGGSMMDPAGNYACIKAATRHDMGVFIISANDKAGMLWKPAKVLVDCCRVSNISPIAMNALWLWSHKHKSGAVHTISIGPARTSDFDEVVRAAKLLPKAEEVLLPVIKGLKEKAIDKLDLEWMRSWWIGLPGVYDTPTGVHVQQIVWLHNLVSAWGMWHYACARYRGLESNALKWSDSNTAEQNLSLMNQYVPGMPADPKIDLSLYLEASPHKEKVLMILKEAHEWFCKENEEKMESKLEERGWLAAFDLQPDVPYPERK
mmetsp:Transcript_4312/g.6573  ORF Transcript_4312/g.6573 Transcript_4312/m.6573 type:complete len:527 (+) Transcript_4312:330-1910(+)